VLGDGYAPAHPEVLAAAMVSASLDWAAMTIAAALVAEEAEERAIVPARELLRVRP
jgi:hypothetical protein